MNGVLGEKRRRELEDQEDDRATKKAKNNSYEIYELPEELILTILVKVSKKYIGEISLVSKQWLQITRSRNFWKASCYDKWPTMNPDLNINTDLSTLTVPILAVNGTPLIDWQSFFYLRKRITEMIEHITALAVQDDHHEIMEGIAKCDDFSADSIMKVLEYYLQIFPKSKIVPPGPALLCNIFFDIALTWYRKGIIPLAAKIVNMMHKFISGLYSYASSFRLCRKLFEFCHVVEYESEMFEQIFCTTVKVFRSLPSFGEREKRLLHMITEFSIKLGSLHTSHVDYDIIVFQYPADQYQIGVLHDFVADKLELSSFVIDTSHHVYQNSDDSKVKAAAIFVAWLPDCTHRYYKTGYYELAMKAFEDPDVDVSFAGLVGLNMMTENSSMRDLLNDQQWTKVFEAHVAAFRKFPLVITELYNSVLKLMKDNKPHLIPDSIIDDLISNVLLFFQQVGQIPEESRHVAYQFQIFGKYLQSRLKHTFEQVKTVFFEAAQLGALIPERLLACYVQYGINVQGPAFTLEFRKLAQQITNGTLPFHVSVLECYEQFGAIWVLFAESEDESDEIVKCLLMSIPEEVYEYGQMGYTRHELHEASSTKNQLCKEHTYDLHRLHITSVTVYKPKSTVPYSVEKSDLKPVRLKAKLRHANSSETLSQSTIMSYNSACQLSLIVREHRRYLKHVQDVLHALLAMKFGVPDKQLADWFDCVRGLLELCVENMNPKDLLHYIDIILSLICQYVKRRSYRKQLTRESVLFLTGCCYDIAINLPTVSIDLLETLIDTMSALIDAKMPFVPNLADFIRYISITWPNLMVKAIDNSGFSIWLCDYVEESISLEYRAQYLNVYASLSALFGYDIMMQEVLSANDDYEAGILKACRELYTTATRGLINLSETDLMCLRIFLILQAAQRINPQTGTIGIIPKTGPRVMKLLREALEDESFDTGVPDLNDYVKSLSFDAACRLLFVNQKDHDDDSEEEEDDELDVQD